MKIMGLDLGSKTLGIAISDDFQMLARSLDTIRFNTNQYHEAIAKLKPFIDQFNIETIVLGYPKNMDGSVGFQGQETLKFKEKLAVYNIPIILWDERLTSQMAQNYMIKDNKKRTTRKQTIDQEAAKLILQGYLDSKK
ncbi:MAG: Holliday junction resolvase RuvX [Candidatus Izemoplasmataceae bacterium]